MSEIINVKNLIKKYDNNFTAVKNLNLKINQGEIIADIFIYTCIRTVEHTGGFEILREACQGKPFINYPNILKICDEVEKQPKIIETVGSKFKDCPI